MTQHLEMTPVASTMMSAYHYDQETRALTVEFKGGSRYRYDDVPIDKVTTMAGAQSPGSYFTSRIKGLHSATKL